jgi:hypothetical protein
MMQRTPTPEQTKAVVSGMPNVKFMSFKRYVKKTKEVSFPFAVCQICWLFVNTPSASVVCRTPHSNSHSSFMSQEKEVQKYKKQKETARLLAADTANFEALKALYDKHGPHLVDSTLIHQPRSSLN